MAPSLRDFDALKSRGHPPRLKLLFLNIWLLSPHPNLRGEMAILFIVALVLAWPTFGLSLVAWFVLHFIKSNGDEQKRTVRESGKLLLEPLFAGRFAKFFTTLDVPILDWAELNDADAEKCGRHIMAYLAHNPEEGALFIRGLQKWKTKGAHHPLDPVIAAESENMSQRKGEIHLASYRAIESLMTNNRQLTCFRAVCLPTVTLYRGLLEIGMRPQ